MSKVKYDLSRVPRELLEKYVAASMNVLNRHNYKASDIGSLVLLQAQVPLRTKAEVNADIIDLVRSYHSWFRSSGARHYAPYYNSSFVYKGKNTQVEDLLAQLNDEETSD